MRITDWIMARLPHRQCPSTEFMYDDMASQSGYSLPVIYKELDVTRRGDWRDEGQILDFACVAGAGAKVLDLGPGDGWPSLRIAPFVAGVIGVDASRRRVQVCTENAARLGIPNARFGLVGADGTLPCASASLDAVVAASSFEQTPDPAAMLRECARGAGAGRAAAHVLRGPGPLPRRKRPSPRSDGCARMGAPGWSWSRATWGDGHDGPPLRAQGQRRRASAGFDPDRLTPSPWKSWPRPRRCASARCAPPAPPGRGCRLRVFASAEGTNGGQVAADAFEHRERGTARARTPSLREHLLPLVRVAQGRLVPLDRNPWITAIR